MIEMLSDYDPYDFNSLDSLRRPNFLKWNGAIGLWQSGIPSIDVMLADHAEEPALVCALEKFMARNENRTGSTCCIRFDHAARPPNKPGQGGIARTDFGGITKTIRGAQNQGWVPSVWIFGGNRDAIRTICALSFCGGGFIAEFLPSGYESHDITKSVFTPSAIIRTKPFAPPLRELADYPESLSFYLDFWREAPGLSEKKREKRLAMCAGLRGISIAEQAEIFRRENPLLLEDFLDLSNSNITELVQIAADFADFYTARGFALENTTIGMDLLPNGHWFLVNLYNDKKFG